MDAANPTPTEHDRAIRAEELAAGPESAVAAVRGFLARRRELGYGDVRWRMMFGAGRVELLTGDHLDRLITAATTPDPAPTQAAPDLAALAAAVERGLRHARVVDGDGEIMGAGVSLYRAYFPVSEVSAAVVDALVDPTPAITVGDPVPDHAAAVVLPAGTTLTASDGRTGLVHGSQVDTVRHVTWANGAREQYSPDAVVWPATIRDLPDAATATGGEA